MSHQSAANQNKKSLNKFDKSLVQSLAQQVSGAGQVAATQARKLFEVSTQFTGQVANTLGNNWFIRKLAGVLNLSWLVGASDNVNLDKAAESVKKLKQTYPNETPQQLAHRIMVEKATKAGGIGLATSVIPGVAAALLAIDLAATTELQSEMVYQIAALYGLDLKDPARKGEVVAIFGLALGGGRLLKAAGLSLLRNVPFAGAVIGASSNATMIYSLGYAACRFYEAKLDDATDLNSEATIDKLKQESEKYLEKAVSQQAIMDRILVHMILSSHPNKTWEEILPELKAINIGTHSLEEIGKSIHSPQPIEELLNQLDRDYAITLLAQCQRIAQINSNISPEEQKIIGAIQSKFQL
ncbi:hypothetical protein NIES2101_16840 [Calothrix sp. HK-06]|nr:hypothetical protein NIES2101_16840 [Calothrix sp. HK-06]